MELNLFDPYPLFIKLVLSCVAAIQAPVKKKNIDEPE